MVAARERFPGRIVTPGDAGLWLVRLSGPPPALHLTHQPVLDALDLDDRVSTGRLGGPGRDALLDTCGALSDAVHDWWDGAPPPLVYRSRTMPTFRSMAFTATAAWASTSHRPLPAAKRLLVELVLHHGFEVPVAWLTSR